MLAFSHNKNTFNADQHTWEQSVPQIHLSTIGKMKKKLGKLDKPQGTELRSAPRAFCFNKLQGSRQVLVVYKLY